MRFRPVGVVLYCAWQESNLRKVPARGGATGSVSAKLPAWALVAAIGTGAAVDGSQGESAWGRRGRKQGSSRVETGRSRSAMAESPPDPGNRIYLATSETRSASGDDAKGGQRGRGRRRPGSSRSTSLSVDAA